MKAVFDFVATAWALIVTTVLAAILLYTMVDGATLVKPWVWGVLAVISMAAGITTFVTKQPRWLALIPIFAVPMFLAGGMQSSTAVTPTAASVSQPGSIQGAGTKVLGVFFDK